MSAACRYGFEEYDGARYCFEHAGFLEAGLQSRRCDRAPTVRPGLPTAHPTPEPAPVAGGEGETHG